MSPMSQDFYVDASDAPAGFASSRQERPPPRRGNTLPPRASSVILSRDGHNEDGTYGLMESAVLGPRRHGSATVDWVVGTDNAQEAYATGAKTVGQRLDPTLKHARSEMTSSERKAMLNGYTLNAAIGMQVVLGALVTGLSSALPSGKAGITTAILGGISTIVASYLARMRGSREPELSLTRAKDLNHFIREAEAFQLDFGHIKDGSKNAELEDFRRRFEELLGNAGGRTLNRAAATPVDPTIPRMLPSIQARIKKIMQKDEEVGKVAQATPIVISKALELFLAMITEESSKVTVERGAKKVEVYHLKHAVETTEMLDFLKEIVEGVPDPSAGGTIDLEADAEAKRKRGKGKKADDGGEEKPKRQRKKKVKKGSDDEDADMGAAHGPAGDDDDEDDDDERPSGSGWKTKPGKEAWRGDR
ncbi:hypothetical protein HWV62_20812 [Athelia sp. TMB]|nr:hypothetical protein HWV62_20812 [Athelia sp. TMB]